MALKQGTKANTSGVAPELSSRPAGDAATASQKMARMITGPVLPAVTLKQFSGAGDALDVCDLIAEMKKAGDEAVSGHLGRAERMLANQFLTLDVLFNNLAQRAGRQDSIKGMEALMRLALKAQAQSRATAEALSIMKNPMPYIKQTNIAHGHQQVNNAVQTPGAKNFQTGPNELLEATHGQRLDTGAQAAPGRIDPQLETMAAVHRPRHN